jgi:AcrR family transcriptional regulator
VPAAERREALIEAAISEFARSGLHGTPVSRIAQRIGVAQPYVFSLFPTKRDLFLAAVERCFDRVDATFAQAAAEFQQDSAAAPGEARSDKAGPGEHANDSGIQDLLGQQAIELLMKDREVVMLQLQSYAACDDDVIREHVRARWAQLAAHVQQLTGANATDLSEFFSWGMWYTVMIAIGASGIDELFALASTQHQAGAPE